MAARLSAGATLDVQPPELLPIAVERDITGWRYTYDVAEDGQGSGYPIRGRRPDTAHHGAGQLGRGLRK